MENRKLFREITLIKHERLLMDNHVIPGKISDIYKNGEIIYEIQSRSKFHTAGMLYHGMLFFKVADESCFVSGKAYFQPPNHIIIIPREEIASDKRKELRIETPALPAEIFCKHRLIHLKTKKGFIADISPHGAALLTETKLQQDILYRIKTSFPFHNQSLKFISPFTVKQCRARKNMFLTGIAFLNMDTASRKNLDKYIMRRKA